MRDAGVCEILVNCKLRRHYGIVGRGEDRVNVSCDKGGCCGDDLVVGVRGLLDVFNVLRVEVCFRVGYRGGGVRLGQGVQQADLLDIRVLREHHVKDEGGIQRVAGAGDVVDAGQVRGRGVGYCGVDDLDAGALSGEGRYLRGGGRDGDDDVDLIGYCLIAQLLENGLVVLAGAYGILDLDVTRGVHLIKAGGDRVCDLVERRMVKLLDYCDFYGAVVLGGGGFRRCRRGAAAAGRKGQHHGTGKEHCKDLLDSAVGFHCVFLRFYMILDGRCFPCCAGAGKKTKDLYPIHMGQKPFTSAIPPKLTS